MNSMKICIKNPNLSNFSMCGRKLLNEFVFNSVEEAEKMEMLSTQLVLCNDCWSLRSTVDNVVSDSDVV